MQIFSMHSIEFQSRCYGGVLEKCVTHANWELLLRDFFYFIVHFSLVLFHFLYRISEFCDVYGYIHIILLTRNLIEHDLPVSIALF